MSLFAVHDLDSPSGITWLLGILGLAYYGAVKYLEAKKSPLNAIPTVGYSGVLTSYITAFKWLANGTALLQEGYDKYPNTPFKVAAVSKWVVVLSGKQHVDEIRKAPEEVLSLAGAAKELLQTKYTFGPVDAHPHHRITIRSGVTRNITSKFEEIKDEIVDSFNGYIPLSEDWVTVPAYETHMHIICRTINRYFVGAPLCRDPGYQELQENFTLDAFLGATIINWFPEILKPFVGRYMTTVPKRIKQAKKYLSPIIEERIAQYEQYGRCDHNDAISWLLDTATEDYHRTVHDIVARVLLLNFTAIHTTTIAFTQAIYDLAIHPEYIEEMHREAANAISEHGWSKAAMQKMRKVDSFVKESLRLNSAGSLSMMRKAHRDWTMSDGTLIPAGTFIGVASNAMNKAKVLFPDADIFKGFRFAEMRDGSGNLDSIKHQMVSLESDLILFGHGRHACPGRFLAVNGIKAMLAHILLNYDLQLENGSKNRPPNVVYQSNIIPNKKAKVMFRKRRVR
ncbi:cytochrome P450 [Macrolepiota fuliginosa MF-IS2]|uniref:Cytochrome P450 n=1 Tax=Macrolepiota fuliginosa MF-IS2 TaxID=1400762 RepID=A0A9P5XQZ1_9AGAR|nr:cytochrome P450 [Macrolepiota fuliginosa MF-IS2]